jgi:hypothetical protein
MLLMMLKRQAQHARTQTRKSGYCWKQRIECQDVGEERENVFVLGRRLMMDLAVLMLWNSSSRREIQRTTALGSAYLKVVSCLHGFRDSTSKHLSSKAGPTHFREGAVMRTADTPPWKRGDGLEEPWNVNQDVGAYMQPHAASPPCCPEPSPHPAVSFRPADCD